MIWPALRAAIYGALTVAEAVVETYERGRRIVGALLPRRREEPFPLTHRDAERIAQAGRCAGHEQEPRCSTLRPPPPRP